MRIDRWNCGTLRRYHFPGGIIVSGPNKSCAVIPGWCVHISTPMDRREAASALRQARSQNRSRTDG